MTKIEPLAKKIEPHRLAAIRATLPGCRLSDDELAKSLDIIIRIGFSPFKSMNDSERKANFRKLKKLQAALKKIKQLTKDVAVVEAVAAGQWREFFATGMDWDTPLNSFEHSLCLLMEEVSAALETRPANDIRRDTATYNLVVNLAVLYTEATGKAVKVPTYDAGTGLTKGKFIDFFRLATAEALGKSPPTDEAIRLRVREAINKGDIMPKKSGRHLCTSPGNAPNKSVTPTNEVTHDDDQNRSRPARRRHQQRSSQRARGAP